MSGCFCGFKKQTAITLIALIITIIVLLILAGITLALTMGPNGIITKAQRAKELTNQTNAEEDIKLRILEATDDQGKVTKDSFLKSLADSQDEYLIELAQTATISEKSSIKEAIGIIGDIYVTNLTNWPEIKVKVKSDFTIESSVITDSIGGTTEDSSENTGNKPTSDQGQLIISKDGERLNVKDGEIKDVIPGLYGKKVKYVAGEGQTEIEGKTWRLFYIDLNGDFGDKGSIYLKADWTDNNTTSSLEYDSSKTLIKQLNPSWAEARSDSESEWKDNEKVAAWLCDPTAWNNYASTAYDEGTVKYAIGAPPAEMFMKSYGNRTGQFLYFAKYIANGTKSYGYKYTIDGNTYNDSYSIQPSVSNGMYLQTETNVYCSEWLASPHSYDSDRLCAISGESKTITRGLINHNSGTCPVVCLSSDFKIEILGD